MALKARNSMFQTFDDWISFHCLGDTTLQQFINKKKLLDGSTLCEAFTPHVASFLLVLSFSKSEQVINVYGLKE